MTGQHKNIIFIRLQVDKTFVESYLFEELYGSEAVLINCWEKYLVLKLEKIVEYFALCTKPFLYTTQQQCNVQNCFVLGHCIKVLLCIIFGPNRFCCCMITEWNKVCCETIELFRPILMTEFVQSKKHKKS